MNKIKKEIRLFKLLEKLKKRDLYMHVNNANLVNEELKQLGWTVGVIWECTVRDHSFKEFDYSILIKPNNSFWTT